MNFELFGCFTSDHLAAKHILWELLGERDKKLQKINSRRPQMTRGMTTGNRPCDICKTEKRHPSNGLYRCQDPAAAQRTWEAELRRERGSVYSCWIAPEDPDFLVMSTSAALTMVMVVMLMLSEHSCSNENGTEAETNDTMDERAPALAAIRIGCPIGYAEVGQTGVCAKIGKFPKCFFLTERA